LKLFPARVINRQSQLSLIALTAAAFMAVVALWVPVSMVEYGAYYRSNLLTELQPRALLGTIASVFALSMHGFNLLILISQYVWLFLILHLIYRSVIGQEAITLKYLFVFFALGFIFSFSVITILTYSPAWFIDVVPYTFIATAIIFSNRIDGPVDWLALFIISVCVMLAVMTHEKSVFDVGILATWMLWKIGLRKTIIYLSPGILASSIFLLSVSTTANNGLPPGDYIDILLSGFSFASQWSLNFWGILAGGGAIWMLYFIFSWQFINAAPSRKNSMYRLLTASLMILICLSSLLVAADTNRMVGLIWLPTVLLLQEVDLQAIFGSFKARVGLVLLCVLQGLIPPVLIYNNGVVPFNCYAVAWISRLPSQNSVIPQTMGPFGLYILNAPILNRPILEKCFPPQ
jgi:hypothetical protein